MADDSFTPRTLIQGILESNPDDVEKTVRVTRQLVNSLNLSESHFSMRRKTRTRHSSDQSSSTAKKARPIQPRLSSTMNETTPRTLIAGFLSSQDSEKTLRVQQKATHTPKSPVKSSPRQSSRRRSLLRQATTRSLHRSVIDTSEEPTPRTLIRGILQEGNDETPVVPTHQQRPSTLNKTQNISVIERTLRSSPKTSSQQSTSSLEDSFMGAYSQPEASQRPLRQRREKSVRSAVSSDDFVASVQEKLSQESQRTWMAQSNLERMNESERTTRQVRHSLGKTVGEIVAVDDVGDHMTFSENESERQEEEGVYLEQIKEELETEDELAVSEQANDKDDYYQEGDESRANVDRDNKITEKADEDESDGESDLSRDYTNMSIVSQADLSQLQQEPLRKDTTNDQGRSDSTFGTDRHAPGKKSEVVVSAFGLKHSFEKGQPDKELDSAEEVEEQNRSLVPPSENEDDTDGPESLPGYNRIFSVNNSPASLQETMEDAGVTGYSALQAPVLPTYTKRVQTPATPSRRSEQIRQTVQAASTDEAVHKKKKPPSTKKNLKEKDTVFPCIPRTNTASIFKHFTTERVSREAIAEVEEVAKEYWSNITADLRAYLDHRGGKTVDESDINLLMTRQRLVTERQSMYTLVEKYLPLEYQMEIIDVVQSGNRIVP